MIFDYNNIQSTCFFYIGTIDFNLSDMPLPGKRSRDCRLTQTSNRISEVKTPVNLFKKKRMEGWWPIHVINEKGERELKVAIVYYW